MELTALHLSVVISSVSVIILPLIGLIGTKSTPVIIMKVSLLIIMSYISHI